MPNERISMSKLKQLIGLQSSNLSIRALARALGLSVGAVSKYLGAVRASGIEAAEAETLSETEVEHRVFGPRLAGKPGAFVAPDCAWIHGELKRHRHVTLQLLWEEYVERHGDAAYRRSAFCEGLRHGESVHEKYDPALFPRIRVNNNTRVFLDVGLHAILEHLLESQLLKAFLRPRETLVITHRAPLISASHELGLAMGANLVKGLGGFSGSELGIGFGPLSLLGFVKFVVRPFACQSEGGGRDIALVSATPPLQVSVESEGETETLLGLIEILCAAPAERAMAAFGIVGGYGGEVAWRGRRAGRLCRSPIGEARCGKCIDNSCGGFPEQALA
jgi:hypothetical protein